jgi:hypothetical protein
MSKTSRCELFRDLANKDQQGFYFRDLANKDQHKLDIVDIAHSATKVLLDKGCSASISHLFYCLCLHKGSIIRTNV